MLPLNRSQIPQLYKAALARHQAGNLDAAATGYRNILSVDARVPEAHFQLGRIALVREDFAVAIEHLDHALTLKPEEPAIWQAYCHAVVNQGDQSRINAFQNRIFRASLPEQIKQDMVQMLNNRGRRSAADTGKIPQQKVAQLLGLMNAARFAEAERLATALAQTDPQVALVLTILANAQAAQGKDQAAAASYARAVSTAQPYAEAHCYFGQFLVSKGRYAEGRDQLNKALSIAPRLPQAWLIVALMHFEQGVFGKAEAAVRKCLAETPADPNGLLLLGKVLVAQGEYGKALPYLEKRVSLAPPDPEARVSLGTALAGLNRSDEADTLFSGVIARHPEMASAHFARATLVQSFGRFDEADASFRKAADLAPDIGLYQYALARNRKIAADDPIIDALRTRFEKPGQAAIHRIYIGYALAKVMEDIGDYGSIFKYLNPAADLMTQLYPYDGTAALDHLETLKAASAGVDFAGRTVKGTSDYAPLFVTGLPRSGTTLVEQILASHSTVTGGGELGIAHIRWHKALALQTGKPRMLKGLGDTKIAAIGREIEREMRAIDPDATHITDKSVLSYEDIGPIRLCLPNAKIVVVRRDPRDCLLSMYKNLFVFGRHTYTYTQRDLAHYYRIYEKIIDYWRETAPDAFYEIGYEDLIANPEAETRKLLDACGLDWEDQCLSFHENSRRVTSLSVGQVRQPMYASSVQAWRRHEADLHELFEALGGDYATKNSAQ